MRSAGCSRGNAQWSARKRAREEIESAPVRRRRRGRAERNFDGDRGREFANANLGGELLDDVPDQLFRHSFAPNLAGAAYTPKETTGLDSSRRRPVIQKPGHPVRNWDGSNVTSLPAEVHNCPMPLALLKMANGQHRQLMPPKPAGEQKCKKRPITFTLHLPGVGRLPQSLPLLGGQPVAKPYSQFLNALDSPYPSSQ